MAKTRLKRRKPCVHPTIAAQKKARTCRVSFDIGHAPGKQGRREETCWTGLDGARAPHEAHRDRRLARRASGAGRHASRLGGTSAAAGSMHPSLRDVPGGKNAAPAAGTVVQHNMPRRFTTRLNAPRYYSTHGLATQFRYSVPLATQRAATVAPAAVAVGTAGAAPSAGVLGKSPQPPPSARIRLTVDTACAPAS